MKTCACGEFIPFLTCPVHFPSSDSPDPVPIEFERQQSFSGFLDCALIVVLLRVVVVAPVNWFVDCFVRSVGVKTDPEQQRMSFTGPVLLCRKGQPELIFLIKLEPLQLKKSRD